MGRNPKPLPFKRGDEVIFINTAYGLYLSKGTVTAVRNDKGIVYVQSIGMHGSIWKRSFAREPGMFQSNPYPLWQLRPLNGESYKSLEKRAKHADKLYKEHKELMSAMERQLERDVYEFKSREHQRRAKEIPHGFDYLNRVAARMGFKKPK